MEVKRRRRSEKSGTRPALPNGIWASLDGAGKTPEAQMLPCQLAFHRQRARAIFRRGRQDRLHSYVQISMLPHRGSGGPGSDQVDLSQPVANRDIEFAVLCDTAKPRLFGGQDSVPTVGMSVANPQLTSQGVVLDLTAQRDDHTYWRPVMRFNLLRYTRRRKQRLTHTTVGEDVRELNSVGLGLKATNLTLYSEPPAEEGAPEWIILVVEGPPNRVNIGSTIMYRINRELFDQNQIELILPGAELPRCGEVLSLGIHPATDPVFRAQQGCEYFALELTKRGRPLRGDTMYTAQADTGYGPLGVQLLEQVGDYLEGSFRLDQPTTSWTPQPWVSMTEDQLAAFLDDSVQQPLFSFRQAMESALQEGTLFISATTESTVSRIVGGEQPYLQYANGRIQAVNRGAMLLHRGSEGHVPLAEGVHVKEGDFLGYYRVPGIRSTWEETVRTLGSSLRVVMDEFVRANSMQPQVGWEGSTWLIPADIVAGISEAEHSGLYWTHTSQDYYDPTFNSHLYPVMASNETALRGFRLGDMRISFE